MSIAATGGLLVTLRAQQDGALFPTHYIQIDPDDRVLIWSAQPGRRPTDHWPGAPPRSACQEQLTSG